MIRRYIDAALAHARYELLTEDKTFYCDIPDCQGVYTSANTLEMCRKNLEEILEEWILIRIFRRLPIPEIDGIRIEVKVEDVA
ncbi:MAG: type II toxin-antitoxin system HicB family antitoxin [Candidatus Latescibacter sp.]|nr:type II toxin-antitoxin system HicB family antitoxin [Candidatus Latescibacter sp.]